MKIFQNLNFSWKRITLYCMLFVVFLFVWSNVWISYESKDFVQSETNQLPSCKVGLLLGTSKMLKNGNQNPFFTYRINATIQLYKAGKIKHVLISGDNSTKAYNEPEDMMNELIAAGIPADKISLDYAGFDTYDSVLRANKIFGQYSFIVISQRFHAERAVYIARRYGFDVWGFAAQDVSTSKSFMTHVREYFARVKAYVEVKLGVDPYFLGEQIEIK